MSGPDQKWQRLPNDADCHPVTRVTRGTSGSGEARVTSGSDGAIGIREPLLDPSPRAGGRGRVRANRLIARARMSRDVHVHVRARPKFSAEPFKRFGA